MNKKEINDQHREEAKRLIKEFFNRSLEDLVIYTYREEFKKAKENALKCCDEIIKELKELNLTLYHELNSNLYHINTPFNSVLTKIQDLELVKQAIKDYNHE